MPDVKKVLVIGSGPIIIGQAALAELRGSLCGSLGLASDQSRGLERMLQSTQ